MKSIKLKYFNKSNIYTDSVLNIVASLILTIATQLIAYPYLATRFSKEEYGVILTIMGIINAIGVSFGNSLNNSRLLLQPEYERKSLNGDYNIVFLLTSIISSLIVFTILIIFLNISPLESIAYIFVTVLISFRAYFSVAFRIKIDYKKILLTNIWGITGYLFGILVASLTNRWILIFVFGEIFSCVYIFAKSHVVHDKFGITDLIKKTLSKYYFILGSAILANLMLYMDRFLIFPLLGAGLVSSYTIASYLGKTAGIIMNPISGVLLTYYAKENYLSLKRFYRRVFIFLIVSILIYIGILIVGRPIMQFLYPTLIEEALPYFKIANLAAIILIYGNTIQPILLRYCHSKWQLITQVLYLCIYLSSSYYGMTANGLLGFCYAILLSNLFRALFMIIIITATLINKETDNEDLAARNIRG